MDARHVPNDFAGENGGRYRTVPDPDDQHVVIKLDVWVSITLDLLHIIFGLKVTWDNNHSEMFGQATGLHSTLHLPREDAITRFTVWSGSRLDRLQIWTRRGTIFEAGGPGGSPREMDVGSGILHGFSIDSTEVLRQLRPHFYRFKVRSASSFVSDNPVGGRGGRGFWACRADDARLKLQKIEFWFQEAINALQVSWSDGHASRWYGSPRLGNVDYFIFNIHRGETITSMGLYGNNLLRQVEFETSLGRHFVVGKRSGVRVEPRLGNGSLVGFEGSFGEQIDSLAPIFESI